MSVRVRIRRINCQSLSSIFEVGGSIEISIQDIVVQTLQNSNPASRDVHSKKRCVSVCVCVCACKWITNVVS